MNIIIEHNGQHYRGCLGVRRLKPNLDIYTLSVQLPPPQLILEADTFPNLMKKVGQIGGVAIQAHQFASFDG